jgi:uncharacterized oxidoreductase
VVVVPQSNGLFGALMTFGEHKGYGMAVACELLGGALSGSGTWHRPADTARAVINGMLTILIDPAAPGHTDTFEQEALAFVDWLRSGPVADGSDGVQLAGRRAARGPTTRASPSADLAGAGRSRPEGRMFRSRADAPVSHHFRFA